MITLPNTTYKANDINLSAAFHVESEYIQLMK